MQHAFGKYTLLSKLATGGMAEVWLARQTGIERFEKKLVIKRILPKFAGDAELKEMFLNEARIAAQFSHPNIVQIYDLGEVGGTYYLAMEYVHGQDLGRVVRRARNLRQVIPLHVAIRIIALSCEGLYYAHTRTDDAGFPLKVIHRDISPQNILVGFDGSVKLVDFGIAKAVNSAAMTKSGLIKGKLSYMAPEQATSKNIDHRVDIFALGLTLYEMLTNTRALKKDSEAATFRAALECNIPPLGLVAGWLPKHLEPIVMKAIAKNRDDRYPDARQFGMALEEFLLTIQKIAGPGHISETMSSLFAGLPNGPSPSMPPAETPKPAEAAKQESRLVNGEPTSAGPWVTGTPLGKSGRYIIHRKLGDGVMSEVFLCRTRGRDGREENVAIKKPHRDHEHNAAFVETLIREVSLAAELSHPNVVRIHEFDVHRGTPFYTMEYVHGRSLGDVFWRNRGSKKPVPPLLVARIGEQVAQGLSYAHQLKVVHHNLSPENVLLSFDGAVKLTDFGTATKGANNAKLAYLAPEEIRGASADDRSDLFSLGVLLWELLTGARLFEANFPAETRGAVFGRTIVPPMLLNPNVPEEMSDLVMKALEREPRRRIQSADALHRVLKGMVAARTAAPEERDLARYLGGLYGDEIALEAERDGVPASPSEAETSPAISPEDITSSMESGRAGDDTKVPR